ESLVDPEDSWLDDHPEIDIVVTPARKVEVGCLRDLLAAHRSKASIEVLYQSMSGERQRPVWRRVTPHALAFDGFRWHVRAYCHLTDRFKDFLLPRVTRTRSPGPAGKLGAEDDLWNDRFTIKIKPHPDLSDDQVDTVVRDYGMVDGIASIDVRYAMLFYVLKRLGLLGNAEKKSARTQHIVLANRDETTVASDKAEFQV
ncbi:WYL domain-containing protein, partial [Altererythrobacter sp.]|nr:WYL domain-containing protein [Altererythrobacter sp.]